MAEVLALEYLFEECKRRFREEGSDVPFLFGRRKVRQQMIVGRRIVWVPGDPNGNVGSVSGPQKNERTADRGLLNLGELCTVYIHGNESLAEEDELAQYRAVRLLHDAWLRQLHLIARGSYIIAGQRYETEAKERTFGETIVVTFSIAAVVPDTPYEATSSSVVPITGGVVPATPTNPDPDPLRAALTAESATSETPQPPTHSETHTLPAEVTP